MVIVAFDGLKTSGKSELANLIYKHGSNAVLFDATSESELPVIQALLSVSLNLNASDSPGIESAVASARKKFPSLDAQLLGALHFCHEFVGSARMNAFYLYMTAVIKEAVSESIRNYSRSHDVVLDGWHVSDWAYRAAFDSLRWTDVMGFFEERTVVKPDVQFVVVKNTGKISDNTGREHINHIRFEEIHQFSIDNNLGFHWVNTDGPESVTPSSAYFKNAQRILQEKGYKFK